MTIGTQTAAPQGAAPAPGPAGLGARPGDAPATIDLFTSLVAQLSGGAPVDRPRAARPAATTVTPGGDQPFPARSAQAGRRPASNDGTPASISGSRSDGSSSDETGNAPIDTTAFVTGAAADPSIAVPAWLWDLGDRGAPPPAIAMTAACTGTADAATADAETTAAQTAAPDRIALDSAARSDSPGSPPSAEAWANGSIGQLALRAGGASPVPEQTRDTDATAAQTAAPDRFAAVRREARIALDRAMRSGSAGSASPVPQSAVDADATVAQTAAPDRFASANSEGWIALDRATRSGSADSPPASPPSAAAWANGSTGQPAPRASGAPPVPEQAGRADATVAQTAAPDRFASARREARIALDRAMRPDSAGSSPSASAWVNGPTGQAAPRAGGESPVRELAGGADATAAQTAALDRVASARREDLSAVDRATQSGSTGSPLVSVPTAAAWANGSTGQVAPRAGGATPVPEQVGDADATAEQTAALDRFASARRGDLSALDRATRSGSTDSPRVGVPSAAAWPGASIGQAALRAGGASPIPDLAGGADATAAQAAAPDRFASARPEARIAFDPSTRSGSTGNPLVSVPSAAAWANGSAGQPAPPAAGDLANVDATDPASAFQSRQSPFGQGVSDQASRYEAQMLAGRAIDAAAAAPFHVAHGASAAAQLVEVVGAGALQTAALPSTAILAAADAPTAMLDEGDLGHQIVQGIKFQWRDGVGDVKVMLRPQYLGEMSIALRVDQGGVTAHLSADVASVRAWASANEPLLRQGLAEQGLTLSRLIVSDKSPESTPDREGRRRAPQQDTPEPPARRRPDSASFEIVL